MLSSSSDNLTRFGPLHDPALGGGLTTFHPLCLLGVRVDRLQPPACYQHARGRLVSYPRSLARSCQVAFGGSRRQTKPWASSAKMVKSPPPPPGGLGTAVI